MRQPYKLQANCQRSLETVRSNALRLLRTRWNDTHHVLDISFAHSACDMQNEHGPRGAMFKCVSCILSDSWTGHIEHQPESKTVADPCIMTAASMVRNRGPLVRNISSRKDGHAHLPATMPYRTNGCSQPRI